MNLVLRELIKKIWQIIPYIVSKLYQYIIILEDSTYIYICLLLVSYGIVYQHYFKLMVKNSEAMFHVLLMLIRWFWDDTWNQIDCVFKEYFIETSSKYLKQLYINTA